MWLPRTSRSRRASRGTRWASVEVSTRMVADVLAAYREEHAVEFTALALANLYGVRQRPNGGVAGAFAHALSQRVAPAMAGDGRQSRDFLYIDDAVDAGPYAPPPRAAGWWSTSAPASQPLYATCGSSWPVPTVRSRQPCRDDGTMSPSSVCRRPERVSTADALDRAVRRVTDDEASSLSGLSGTALVTSRAWPTRSRSCSTIILTSVGKSTSGFQPSFWRALAGSPMSRSTSAGRKHFWSWRTYFSPVVDARRGEGELHQLVAGVRLASGDHVVVGRDPLGASATSPSHSRRRSPSRA